MYDELIKNLRKMQNHEYCVLVSIDGFPAMQIVKQAADAIEDLEKSLAIALLEYQIANNKRILTEEYAKQMQRWIPVTERLPLGNNLVLAAANGGVVIAIYGNYRWAEAKTYAEFYPTHWMPLPEPPKEE